MRQFCAHKKYKCTARKWAHTQAYRPKQLKYNILHNITTQTFYSHFLIFMFKKTYTEPAIYIEDVVVENGIASSLSYIENAPEDVWEEEF